ncbi:Methylthioribose kinase [Piscirickettsia salmonis]|uniref:S-methyl-5-thioribose kinase n=1 Tax=Piscirickettsia salmonis TaxID=1238 RepID=UPI0012BB16C8|nr:S-methyl-5-thioribose kinase [Piscirickettsia salmonis]QGP53304.1 Methylthioribose kinase [Piscirickettsia salmonis]QGP60775.1 Methylthioribose kinase [Piscirickettsia salmonis]QGP62869.1 Methylthioribose kinase [Piscirickettsia salmonis]
MNKYQKLNTEKAIKYVKQYNIFFTHYEHLRCEEIGDGNLNLVFRLINDNDNKSLIIKQALPYARCVGESWPLSLDRARIEAESTQIQANICPGYVPKIYHTDNTLALTIMEDLSDHVVLRKALISGQSYPELPQQIGSFLAHTLFYTSNLYLDSHLKKQYLGQFINPDLCKITEDLVLTDPFFGSERNHYDQEIQTQVAELQNNQQLQLNVAALKLKFLSSTEALLHGDVHTGSIFVKKNSMKVFDSEFAYYGPMGFDIGLIIGNMVLSLCSHFTQNNLNLVNYCLNAIEIIWKTFESKFTALAKEHTQDLAFKNDGYINHTIKNIFADTIGYAGCEIIRRIIGLAHVEDLDGIENKTLKNKAEILALTIGQQFILEQNQLHTIDNVIQKLQGHL